MTTIPAICLQLSILTLGFSCLGWGLGSLAAPLPIWVGTGLTVGYVVWAGRAGLFLASVWMTLLISLVITFKIFPPHWLEYFRYGFWPLSLMLFWGVGVGLFTLLGNYVQSLQPLPLKARVLGQWISLVVVLLGLVSGRVLFPHPIFLQP
ncbi:MAG: hypothetical protein ACKO5P_09630 [Nodosilinea sp.]